MRFRWAVVAMLMLAVPGVLIAACFVNGTLPFPPRTAALCFATHHGPAPKAAVADAPFAPTLPVVAHAGPGVRYAAVNLSMPSPPAPDDELFGRLRI